MQPIMEQTYAVPMSSIKINGDRLAFQHPKTLQPEDLRVLNMSKMLSGLDADEFFATLRKQKSQPSPAK